MQTIDHNFIPKQSSLCHWQPTCIRFWNVLANGSQISISCINKNAIDSSDLEFAWECEQGYFSQGLVKTVWKCQQFLAQPCLVRLNVQPPPSHFSIDSSYPPQTHITYLVRQDDYIGLGVSSVLVGYINTWPFLISWRFFYFFGWNSCCFYLEFTWFILLSQTMQG